MEKCSVQAVLFDLDGTLTDTLGDIADAMNHTLRAFGLPEWETDAYRYLVGDGPLKLTERAVRNRQDLVKPVLEDYLVWYGAHSDIRTAPYPGIPELLRDLRRRGLPLCVYSNKQDPDTKAIVKGYFPDIDFAVVLGSRPGQPMKPAPDMPLSIARRLNLPPQAFAYLGDTDVDMRCAVSAGMHPFGVLWGFRDAQELTAGGAEVLLSRPSDLLSCL